jgi:RNA polymerase sigma-70 factor, ECF subfamily
MSSEPLVERIRTGDTDALAQLIEDHRAELLGFIQHISQDKLLKVVPVEDLLQEVASSAVAALPRIASEELDPLSWLKQLARRRVIDAYRFHFQAERRARSRERDAGGRADDSRMGWEQLIVASITSPSEAVSRNMRLGKMQQAISGLGQEAAEAIRMRYVDGLSTRQIAEQLGKSDVAVRVMLSRSIRKLQELLGDNQESVG